MPLTPRLRRRPLPPSGERCSEPADKHMAEPSLSSGADLAYLWESRAPRTPCQEVDMYTQLGLYIDGEWLNGDNRAGEDVINPANEKVLARLPHASPADLDRALAAAVKCVALWREKSTHERGRIMKKAADLHREPVGRLAPGSPEEQRKSLDRA